MNKWVETKVFDQGELEVFYKGLGKNLEGYVNMSDDGVEIFDELKKWEDLHNGKNFILEAGFSDHQKSIKINFINGKFYVLEVDLSQIPSEYKNENCFLVRGDSRIAKITQVWEDMKNQECLGFESLELKYLFFSGFGVRGNNGK